MTSVHLVLVWLSNFRAAASMEGSRSESSLLTSHQTDRVYSERIALLGQGPRQGNLDRRISYRDSRCTNRWTASPSKPEVLNWMQAKPANSKKFIAQHYPLQSHLLLQQLCVPIKLPPIIMALYYQIILISFRFHFDIMSMFMAL